TPVRVKSSYREMLSVIICTTREPQYTAAVIDSLDITNTNYETEIIVVNNTNREFNLTDIYKSTKIINEPILGLSKARNRGAAEAGGEYLFYMDDDALANPNLLNNMFAAFKKHSDFVVIGGQIFLNIPTPTPNVFLNGRESLWSAYIVPYKNFKRVKEQYELPYGACFGIRHSFLDKIGGFPESYGRCGDDYAGGEETAVCLSAIKNGLKIGIEPSVSVRHMVEPTRFSKEHVFKTITASIVTTYRLFLNGYLKSGWTVGYINERINILKTEISRLGGLADSAALTEAKSKTYNAYDKTEFKTESEKIIFYKLCELYAFEKTLAAAEEEQKCLS
ncbi:MAG: glycosyltransferase family 2 protein, partial [Clostridiales bacterium]|nr:glycosyltransferase family 2 protein [Clostridiales bacterium]